MYAYIIIKDGILRNTCFNITFKRGVYFSVHSLLSSRTNCHPEYCGNHYPNGVLNDMLSELGLNSGYTVKNTPLPSGGLEVKGFI